MARGWGWKVVWAAKISLLLSDHLEERERYIKKIEPILWPPSFCTCLNRQYKRYTVSKGSVYCLNGVVICIGKESEIRQRSYSSPPKAKITRPTPYPNRMHNTSWQYQLYVNVVVEMTTRRMQIMSTKIEITMMILRCWKSLPSITTTQLNTAEVFLVHHHNVHYLLYFYYSSQS